MMIQGNGKWINVKSFNKLRKLSKIILNYVWFNDNIT